MQTSHNNQNAAAIFLIDFNWSKGSFLFTSIVFIISTTIILVISFRHDDYPKLQRFESHFRLQDKKFDYAMNARHGMVCIYHPLYPEKDLLPKHLPYALCLRQLYLQLSLQKIPKQSRLSKPIRRGLIHAK